MRFNRLLIHRCTLITHDVYVGDDEYNQPIYGDKPILDVSCRADQVKKFISRDANGANFITQYVLFTGPDQLLKNDMTVQDIKDKLGNIVLEGTFTLESATPCYNRVRLHHYEATLKGVSIVG